jgi:hypothetical protein
MIRPRADRSRDRAAVGRRRRVAGCLGVAIALVAAGCGWGAGPSRTAPPSSGGGTTAAAGGCVRNEQDTACLPVAPDAARVDRARPGFTDPTRVTNPRFPAGSLTQVLQLGHEGGRPLRVEITRLPNNRTFTWDGRRVDTVASQFVAYRDGRIQEVAVDHFAQADDGSVWYFGEDVANYEDGRVANHDGSWLAGRDGPPGMIMPADPKVGDVYRSENIPGLVFEQDTVRSTAGTVDGPRGPVRGAALVEELLMDGTVEEKAYAPGYGEFRAQAEDELVTVALALPVDRAGGGEPAALAGLVPAARSVAAAAAAGSWPAAAARADAMAAAWTRARGGVPELLAGQLRGALAALAAAAGARDPARARQAALAAEQAALDLRLRHRAPAQVDLERLDLWSRRLLADADAGDRGGVAGDVATLRVLWDRAGHAVAPAAAATVAAALTALGDAAGGRGLDAAAARVPAFRAALSAAGA